MYPLKSTPPERNGLSPAERQAYTTNCQGCQNPLTACVCVCGPTLPAEQHTPDPIYDYMKAIMDTPDRCHECHQLIGSDPTADDNEPKTTHMLTTGPGIDL
jgi:hypothetical protein